MVPGDLVEWTSGFIEEYHGAKLNSSIRDNPCKESKWMAPPKGYASVCVHRGVVRGGMCRSGS